MGRATTQDGKDLMLWVGGKVIALSTSCTITLSATTTSADTKDDGIWGADEVGKINWTASNDSLMTADESRTIDKVYDDLFGMMVAHEPIEVSFAAPNNANNNGVPEEGWTLPAAKYSGKAIISNLTLTGAVGSKGTINVSLNGIGKLAKA